VRVDGTRDVLEVVLSYGGWCGGALLWWATPFILFIAAG
jgi:hypothetical protein